MCLLQAEIKIHFMCVGGGRGGAGVQVKIERGQVDFKFWLSAWQVALSGLFLPLDTWKITVIILKFD